MDTLYWILHFFKSLGRLVISFVHLDESSLWFDWLLLKAHVLFRHKKGVRFKIDRYDIDKIIIGFAFFILISVLIAEILIHIIRRFL